MPLRTPVFNDAPVVDTPLPDLPSSGIPSLHAARRPSTPAAPAAPPSDGTPGWVVPAALGAGTAALGAVLHNPSGAANLVSKGARALQDLRVMGMLSGLAVPKSMLGNLGAATVASVERGSMAPLKSLLSMETLRDVGSALKHGPTTQLAAEGAPTTFLARANPFGRVMGAFDDATQAALRRSGVMHDPTEVATMMEKGMGQSDAMAKSAAKAAERETLQAPLPYEVRSKLESPAAQYLVPFRRTPFNQFLEGIDTMRTVTTPGDIGKKVMLGIAGGTGYASGATADDPKTLGLTTAAMGRYGLPHAMGAMLGRYAKTGSKRKAADAMQGMSPVSDYSLSEGVLGPWTGTASPLKPLTEPAALKALKYILGE